MNFKVDSFSIKIILMSYGSLCINFLYSLEDIICYQILYIKDIDINLFLLFIGLSRLIFGFIFSLINNYKYFNINIFEWLSNILQQDLLTIVLIFINCITIAVENALSMLIFKLFQPWFYGITFSVKDLIYFLFFSNEKYNYRIYKIILMIIIIIGYLIFCELIICNFCGLNENTKKEIAKRSEDEINQILLSERKYKPDNSILF